MKGKARRGYGYALMIGLCIIVVVGIVYAVLYYGGMLPEYKFITGSTPAGSFTPVADVEAFFYWVGAAWMLVLTFALIAYWWQQSNKPGPGY